MGHIFWNEYARLRESGENVEVLALGDSWFHYLFNNLITPLYGVLEQPTIFVIGESGARADELAKGSWLANFTKMLVDYPSIAQLRLRDSRWAHATWHAELAQTADG